MKPFPFRLPALAAVVALVGCSSPTPSLRLAITADADVGALSSLTAYVRVSDGDAERVESLPVSFGAPRDLSHQPYILQLDVPDRSPFATDARLAVIGSSNDTPVATWTSEHDLREAETIDVTLSVLSVGCDKDEDGFKDCDVPSCCSLSEKSDWADCDDAEAKEHPFADQPACRDCRDLGQDGVADCLQQPAEPTPEAAEGVGKDTVGLDSEIASDADVTNDGTDVLPDSTPDVSDVTPEQSEADVPTDGYDEDDGPDVCTPDCTDKACGDDGCGGSCGGCATGKACVGGACICPDECSPGGKKECTDSTHFRTCGDPDSDTCLEWSPDSACAAGSTCDGGECACTPSCAGKTCGDNGCGGSCGVCIYGKTCAAGQCSCAGTLDGDCDNVDDDCDGLTDEHYTAVANCFKTGACAAGNKPSSCSTGVETACKTGTPGIESCNNVDDDCDGSTDEGGDALCSVDETCEGSAGCMCAPDCAGLSCGDDGCGGSCGSCSPGKDCVLGACVCSDPCSPSGKKECTDATHFRTCGDPDGDTCLEWSPVSACTAGTTCNGGTCACTPDCAGKVCGDNGCGGSCGSCSANKTCSAGQCVCAGTTDSDCDNVDDDCDGQTDEHYAASSACFKTGACAAANKASSCAAGVETACKTGTPAASDATCNGSDDDCNGQTDEDYVPVTTCFKPGACAAANKASSCTAGVETACKTGTPAANDATCNGVDDDCDGLTDEHYVPVSTCFKTGACAAANKASSCTAGVETACKTGTPAASDATCNGVDNDCDGLTDEHYVASTACFETGACAAGNKASSCTAGVETACKTGTPAFDDAMCNAVDDDCDGQTDEDATCDDGVESTVDSCEAGACKYVAVTSGFIYVPAGSFWMGSPDGQACPSGYTGGGCPYSGMAASELGNWSTEALHYVKLTTAFELQEKELTQGQWKAIYPAWNPSSFTACGTTCPVEQVSWYDALAYANAKSVAAGRTPCYVLSGIACEDGTSVAAAADCMTSTRGGINVATVTLNGVAAPYQCTGFRLPTESEWEYACRAGSSTAFYPSEGNDGTITETGSDPNLDKIAWYNDDSGATTKPGGGKAANAWGLYDMLGNVLEWCWDWETTYPTGTVANPAQDPLGGDGSVRVARGGDWDNLAYNTRAARRLGIDPGRRQNVFGFRLARSLP